MKKKKKLLNIIRKKKLLNIILQINRVLKQIQEISMETCLKKKKKQKQYVRNSYKNMKKMQNKKLVFAQYKNE